MATPRVWRAQPHEAEAVAELLVAFRDEMGRDWPSANAFHAGVERLIELPDCVYLLSAVDDDAPPVGVCQLRFRWGLWFAAPDCWLEDLFVQDEARRHGVGAALVEATFAEARSRGCRRVELDCRADNEPAMKLYERFGFATGKVAGTQDLLLRARLDDAS